MCFSVKFEDSDFDFLANKCSSNIPTDDRNSILLRFDPFLGIPVPIISGISSKVGATIEEETTNLNCFGGAAGAGAVAATVEEQSVGAIMSVDMKIENMTDIKTSLDDKQDYKMADLEKKVKNELWVPIFFFIIFFLCGGVGRR